RAGRASWASSISRFACIIVWRRGCADAAHRAKEGKVMTRFGRSAFSLALTGVATVICGTAAGQSSILGSIPPPAEPTDLRSEPAETLAAAVTDPHWRAPRTSWGHPSIEGVWSSDDMRSVPFNRPEQFGMRESLTQEEFYARASQDQG